MKRSFRIEFIRKADELDKENRNCGWYDEEAGYVYDSTEFDTEYNNMEVIFVDLINLFNGSKARADATLSLVRNPCGAIGCRR